MDKFRTSKFDVLFDITNHILLLIVLVIVLYPLIYVVSASLSDPLYVMQGKVWILPKGITLEAYKRVFQDRSIMTGYINTIKYTFVGTAVNLILTVLGAYPLSRKDLKGRNVIMLAFTFTMFFSGGLIPTYLVIQKLGLINNFLVMILPSAISMYNLIIMRTFFQNTIPFEIQEAAYIDGCSNTRILLSVILPLSTPIIAVIALFYGVAHWNAYFNAMLYLSNKKMFPLQLVLRGILIQSQMREMMDVSESMTSQMLLAESIKYSVMIVSSVPVLLLYPMIQRYFVKGVMVGAIKG
jgi:putative aldouronate transport system permease protein